jgi:nicotinamidase-related amidase
MEAAGLRLDPATTALIVVDMQNDFCHRDGFYARQGQDIAGLQAPVPAIAALLERARATGATVVFTRILRDPATGPVESARRLVPKRWFSHGERLIAGSWGAAVIDALAPRDDEPVIDKHGYSAFHRTDLAERLHAKGVRDIVFCGVVTYACVLASAFAAFDQGFGVVLARDAAGSWIETLGHASEDVVDLLLGHAVPVDQIRLEA